MLSTTELKERVNRVDALLTAGGTIQVEMAKIHVKDIKERLETPNENQKDIEYLNNSET